MTTLLRAVPTKLWKEGFVVNGKVVQVVALDSPKKVGIVIECKDKAESTKENKALDKIVQAFNEQEKVERLARQNLTWDNKESTKTPKTISVATKLTKA